MKFYKIILFIIVIQFYGNNYLLGQIKQENINNIFYSDSTISNEYVDISFSKPMFKVMINFYQKIISPTKGSTCKMYPSCSEYGKLAMSENGIIVGSLMICDRLNRCGHDLNHYEKISINGVVFNKDLVEKKISSK